VSDCVGADDMVLAVAAVTKVSRRAAVVYTLRQVILFYVPGTCSTMPSVYAVSSAVDDRWLVTACTLCMTGYRWRVGATSLVSPPYVRYSIHSQII